MNSLIPFGFLFDDSLNDARDPSSPFFKDFLKASWNSLNNPELALAELEDDNALLEANEKLFNISRNVLCSIRSDLQKFSQAAVKHPKEISLILGSNSKIPGVSDFCKLYKEMLDEVHQIEMDEVLNETHQLVQELASNSTITSEKLTTLADKINQLDGVLGTVNPKNIKLTPEQASEILNNLVESQNQDVEFETNAQKIKSISQSTRVGVLVLTTALERTHPQAARNISVIGHSVINMAESASLLKNMVSAGASWVQMIGPIGAIVGSAAGLLNYFYQKNTRDIPSETLRLVEEVSENIRTMHAEMHQRFDRIEIILGHQYLGITQKLVELSEKIEMLNQVFIGNMQTTHEKLDDLARDVHEVKIGAHLIKLKHKAASLATTIRDKKKFEMSKDRYFKYYNAFISWSEQLAKESDLAGKYDPKIRLDRQTAIKALEGRWTFNINYLNLIASQYYAISLSDVTLPNPLIWAHAVSLYLRLRLNWPQFEFQPNGGRDPIQSSLANETKQLRNFVLAIQSKTILVKVLKNLKNGLEALQIQSLDYFKIAFENPASENNEILKNYQFHYLFLYRLCEIALEQSMQFDPVLLALLKDPSQKDTIYGRPDNVIRSFFNLHSPESLKQVINTLLRIPDKAFASYRLNVLFSNMLYCVDILEKFLQLKLEPVEGESRLECPISIKQTKDNLLKAARKCLPNLYEFDELPSPLLRKVMPECLEVENIFAAVMINNVAHLKVLLNKDKNLLHVKDKLQRTLVHIAAMANAKECLAELVAQGASANVFDINYNTPLHLAAEQDSSGVISLLMDAGNPSAAFNSQNERPLNIATNLNHQEFLKELSRLIQLRRKPIVSAGVRTVDMEFINAVRRGDLAAVQIKVNAGIDLNFTTDNLTWTALHEASSYNQIAVMRYLLSQEGIDTEVQHYGHNNGWRPLHNAAWNGKKEAITLLLQAGADSTALTTGAYAGCTPGQLAKHNGFHDIEDYIQNELSRIRAASIPENRYTTMFANTNQIGVNNHNNYNGVPKFTK